jgi:putative transposase
MEKAYKLRIYPDKAQEELIQKTFGCARYVYNHYLAMRKEKYESDKTTFNYYACSSNLTSHKKDNEWLREVDATALKSSLNDLDIAYQNFFRRVKSGDKPGYPRFKSKRDNHKSFRSSMSNNNIRMLNGHIRLPKLGNIKCRVSKQVEGRILSATVSQNPSGKYFVSVLCTDVDIQPMDKTGAMVGVDLGLKELAITSDSQHFANPKHFAKSQKKLAKLQRRLSRKSKGSNNGEKARVKVARLHEHIANQRLDNAHKMTTSLVSEYDLIAIETLVSKNMVKNHRLAKAISDAAWGEIVRQLEYKCNWYGKELVKVDRFYPSSQTCNSCGYKNSNTKNLAVREWDCPRCGVHHDRDVNAAKNILDEGLRILNVA